MSFESHMEQVDGLVARIGPLLHGHPPEVQSGALADLLAMWLAGHFADTPERTDAFRTGQLAMHVALVQELIPVNEKIILSRTAGSAH